MFKKGDKVRVVDNSGCTLRQGDVRTVEWADEEYVKLVGHSIFCGCYSANRFSLQSEAPSHPLHDVIVHWMEGGDVEYRKKGRENGKWVKMSPFRGDISFFVNDYEYRIKPALSPIEQDIANVQAEMKNLSDKLEKLKAQCKGC